VTISSDNVLTATVDNTRQAVTLAVDFTRLGTVPAGTINLIANPSDEIAVGMSAESGTSVARSTAQAYVGGASTALTCTTAGTVAATCGYGIAGQPVSPGTTYTASLYVRAATTGRSVTLGIDWYNAAGTYLSSATGSAVTDSTTWGRRTVTGASPASAAFATVKVYVGAAAVSEVHYVDARQLERGSAATAYCDGSQTGCAWTGAANASVSYRPNFNRLTIYRGDGTIVRGSDQVLAPGGLSPKGYDNEAPRGVPVSYVAALNNGLGTFISTAAVATITSDGRAWLKHLTLPTLSVQLSVDKYPDWTAGISQAITAILGSAYPNAGMDTRQAEAGALSVVTRDRPSRLALKKLLNEPTSQVYLLQASPQADEDADCYVIVGQTGRVRPYAFSSQPKRVTTLPVQQVARPATAGSSVAYPGHTYADSTAALPLYSNRTGTYGSR
jgi:hypothetical protein